jgi:predicted GNAT family acetyltransferase
MEGEDGWVAATGIEDFRDTVVSVLSARPLENNQLLAVFDRLLTEGPHAFGERDPELLARHGYRHVAALLRTPPYAYIVGGTPDRAGVSALADLLLDPGNGHDGREINIPEACEGDLAEAWTRRTGRAPRVIERMCLYRLDKPLAPVPVPAGHAKLADSGDVPIVARLLQEFWTGIDRAQPRDAAMTAHRIAAARVAEGTFWLWLDEAGEAVSLAGTTPVIAGTGRIGPVYTPARLRGRGYAGAVTTAAGRALLERGAGEVLLYTDLANPTSNALYRRLGYRPVSGRVLVGLEG